MGLLEAAASVGGSASASSLFSSHQQSLAAHLSGSTSSQAPSNHLKSPHNTSSGVKVKRTRQRVDAGEPRNSYASIANFSSTRAGYQMARGRMPGYCHPFGRVSNGVLNPFGDHHLNGLKESYHSHQVHQHQTQASQMTLSGSVNGCKKRKLYQPQQTTKSSMSNGAGDPDEEEEEIDEDVSIIERDEESLTGDKEEDQLSPDDLRVEKPKGEKNSSPSKSQEEEYKKDEEGSVKSSEALVSPKHQLVTRNEERRMSNGCDESSSGEKQQSAQETLQQLPPVNGCKKRKLYHPQQTSAKHLKSPVEDEDSLDEDVLSDEEKNDDELDYEDLTTDEMILNEDKHEASESKDRRNKTPPLVAMRQKYPPLFQQRPLQRHGVYSINMSAGKRGQEEDNTGHFLDDARRILRQEREAFFSKETSPYSKSRRTLPESEWLMALETELLENVAKAIEMTFADFGRRIPPTKRLRDEETSASAPTASKDLTLLAQLLESKSPQHLAAKGAPSFLMNNDTNRDGMKRESKSPMNGIIGPGRGRSPFSMATESASVPKSSTTNHNVSQCFRSLNRMQ